MAMARVERRVYRRRRRRRRMLLAVVAALLGVGAVVWYAAQGGGLMAERLTEPSPTPVTASFDRTVSTREVTLPEVTWYAIQTGVFSTQEAAEQKAEAYADRGAPGVVIRDGNKWRVFIACYRNEADAAAVRTRLGESQRVETYLYRWSCPELRLRLTGMAGQMDMVEAGLSQLTQNAAALLELSAQLDAAQLTEDEVRSEVTALRGQSDLWQRTARERFGASVPELVTQLIGAEEDFAARTEQILSTDSATALSAALKLQGMKLFDAAAALRSAIGA